MSSSGERPVYGSSHRHTESRKRDWNVTFETLTEEGDVSKSGFLMQNTTLRHAVGLLRGDVECVESNNSRPEYTRWITVYHAPHSGNQDSYSLHFPDRVTAASRKRLIRLLDEEL